MYIKIGTSENEFMQILFDCLICCARPVLDDVSQSWHRKIDLIDAPYSSGISRYNLFISCTIKYN